MIFGICMVKDEEDVVGPVVAHMLEEVDHVIVANNLSTDNTQAILDSLACDSLTVIQDDDPAYRQSEKMTHLAMMAKQRGAKKVVPFDADEWWRSPYGRLADVLSESDADINVAPLYDHVRTYYDAYPAMIIDGNLPRSIPYRRVVPSGLHKVACKTASSLTIHMGNHNASYMNTDITYDAHDLIEVRHFPYRSANQFVRKAINGANALNLTNLPYNIGQHWRDYARLAEDQGEDVLKEVFFDWFYSWHPDTDERLVYDPV